MRKLLLLLTSFWLSGLSAQTADFINYTSTKKINEITLDGQIVWAATAGGLVRHDRQSGQTTYINRSNSGLPIQEIFSIALGPDGTIWLGSEIGLIRWQGNSFTVLNPLDANGNVIQIRANKVSVDATGRVWMSISGHYSNLLSLDGQEWKAYDDDQLFGGSADFQSNLQTPGIWVKGGDSNAFYFFDGSNKVEYPCPLSADSWKLDNNGKVWVDSGNQLAVQTGNSWETETLGFWPDGIAPAPDGSLWAIDGFNGVYKRSQAGSWEHVFDTYLPFDGYNAQMEADDQGDLWLGTEAEGEMQLHNGVFEQINNIGAEIPENSVAHLEITGTQTVWAIFDDDFIMDWMNGQNISRFGQNGWEKFDNPNAPLWKCKSMAKDGLDRLWLAHFDKLYRFTGQWEELPVPAEFTFGQVYSVAAEPGTNTVWIGGYGKIARYNGDQFQVFDAPFSWLSIEKLAVDQQGNVWMPYGGGNNGEILCRFDGSNWTIFSTDAMMLSPFSSHVREIKVAPNGNVWVLTPYEISRFDGTNWHKFPHDAISFGGEFSTMAFDGTERIWIGCYQLNCLTVSPNLNLIKVEGNDIQLYPYQTTPLPYPNITALAVDAHHNLWIGGEHGGIAVFNENGVVLSATEPGRRFDQLASKVYPNPAIETATVEYTLQKTSDVLLELMSPNGQVLCRQKILQQAMDTYQWFLPANLLPPGTYFWRVSTDNAVASGVICLEGEGQ